MTSGRIKHVGAMISPFTALALLAFGASRAASGAPAGSAAAKGTAASGAAQSPGAAAAAPTEQDIVNAVTNYIKTEAKKSDGLFKVDDAEEDKEISMTLSKVYKNRVMTVGRNAYATCAELIGTDAHIYDVDVTMTGPDADHLSMTGAMVHKKDGVERYTWYQEGGIWKKRIKVAPPPEEPKAEEKAPTDEPH